MNTYIVTTVLFSIITFAWIAVKDRTGLYAYAVFLGLTNGVCQGMFLGSLASLTSDNRKMGTRIGMVHTIVAFATLAGPPVSHISTGIFKLETPAQPLSIYHC
jgi:MFS family permease